MGEPVERRKESDMTNTLGAKFIYTQDDGQVVMVGFADDQFETKNYILLQRTLKPDDSDLELGHDSIHVTIGDQNCSGYGGVKRFVLGASQASLHLASAFADELNIDKEHMIFLQYSELDVSALRDHLQVLFAKSPDCLVLE